MPTNKQNGHAKNVDHAPDHLEFGGSFGTGMMMVFFPLLMYYLWISGAFYGGALPRPESISDFVPWLGRMANHILVDAYPNLFSVKLYISFCLFQILLAVTVPGPKIKGLPIPHENGRQLEYLCNGVGAWYITLALGFGLHVSGLFDLKTIIHNFGPLMTTAMIVGHSVTWITYFTTVALGKQHRMSGHFFYDVFMGAPLNPRIGSLDLKMWVEIRVPWILLFFISVSTALDQHAKYGYVSAPVLFMCLAHFLYTNACLKGEECIPTTWDIFYEKWGFMLIFWNFAGVPFTYVLSTLYLAHQPPIVHSPIFVYTMFTVLLTAYYVWDTANSQKNHFRMQRVGTYVPRWAFPQLPWRTLKDPEFIKTENGGLLLIGGWWKYARKIHYTADLIMALSWGLITGFNSFIPYFYFVFFCTVLTHRNVRDQQRCAKKYGDDWVKYCKKVPYVFIPGLY